MENTIRIVTNDIRLEYQDGTRICSVPRWIANQLLYRKNTKWEVIDEKVLRLKQLTSEIGSDLRTGVENE